ncbi:reverse transcriptase domain-containing protein, partial [Tanacetum coccineum]
MTFVPALSPVSGALSPVRADLIPSPKRVRDSSYLTDVEVDHRETNLRDDAIVRVSDEPHLEQDSDPEVQAEIDECFAYADALRDCRAVIAPNTQRAPVGNQQDQKQEWKQDWKPDGNETMARAYAIGEGGTNPDSNVVMGTFLLNNCYASMLFDSGADRSFVPSIFSALLDVAPSTLDTSYAVELADGRISEINIVLR